MRKEKSVGSVDMESGKMLLVFYTHSECAYIQLQKGIYFHYTSVSSYGVIAWSIQPSENHNKSVDNVGQSDIEYE
jgi:hypothetical protein